MGIFNCKHTVRVNSRDQAIPDNHLVFSCDRGYFLSTIISQDNYDNEKYCSCLLDGGICAFSSQKGGEKASYEWQTSARKRVRDSIATTRRRIIGLYTTNISKAFISFANTVFDQDQVLELASSLRVCYLIGLVKEKRYNKDQILLTIKQEVPVLVYEYFTHHKWNIPDKLMQLCKISHIFNEVYDERIDEKIAKLALLPLYPAGDIKPAKILDPEDVIIDRTRSNQPTLSNASFKKKPRESSKKKAETQNELISQLIKTQEELKRRQSIMDAAILEAPKENFLTLLTPPIVSGPLIPNIVGFQHIKTSEVKQSIPGPIVSPVKKIEPTVATVQKTPVTVQPPLVIKPSNLEVEQVRPPDIPIFIPPILPKFVMPIINIPEIPSQEKK